MDVIETYLEKAIGLQLMFRIQTMLSKRAPVSYVIYDTDC